MRRLRCILLDQHDREVLEWTSTIGDHRVTVAQVVCPHCRTPLADPHVRSLIHRAHLPANG